MEISFFVIFPFTPILIAAVILFFALCGQIAVLTPLITTLSWIVIVVISVLMLIYNFTRETTSENKLICSAYMIASNILSFKSSFWYLNGISDAAKQAGGLGVIDYAFTLFFGGALWLLIVSQCVVSNTLVLDEDTQQGWNYIEAAGRLIGASVVAGIFGFLG